MLSEDLWIVESEFWYISMKGVNIFILADSDLGQTHTTNSVLPAGGKSSHLSSVFLFPYK